MNRLKYLCLKYGANDFTVLGQFAYDIQESEKSTNKELAFKLNKMGYLDNQGMSSVSNFKFLQKVSFQNIYLTFY